MTDDGVRVARGSVCATGLKSPRNGTMGLVQYRGIIFLSVFVGCVSIALVAFMAKIEPSKFFLKPMSQVQPLKEAIRDTTSLSELEFLGYDELRGAAAILLVPRNEDDEESKGTGEKPLLYAGLADGRLISLSESGEIDVIINYTGSTGPKYYQELTCGDSEYYSFMESKCGRPMGLAWDIDGLRIVVSDAYEGLLLIDPRDKVKITLAAVDPKGQPFTYVNSLAVSKSTGRVYFTETSINWERRFDVTAQLESKANGRLLMYDPLDGQTHELLRSCYNPTGILIVENKDGGDDYVLFAEQSRARLRRFMLKNWKPDTKVLAKPDIWLQNLPGLPTGLSWADGGHKKFLVSAISRNFMTDILPQNPLLRQFLFSFPDWLYRFLFVNPSQVLRVSVRKKQIVGTFENPARGAGSFSTVVADNEGRLYFGGAESFFRGIPRTKKPVIPTD